MASVATHFALSQRDLMEQIGCEVEISRNKKNFSKVMDQINAMTNAVLEEYEFDSPDALYETEGHGDPSSWMCAISGSEHDFEILRYSRSYNHDGEGEFPEEFQLRKLIKDCRDDTSTYNERGEFKYITMEATFGGWRFMGGRC
jgi:hypothetical protein